MQTAYQTMKALEADRKARDEALAAHLGAGGGRAPAAPAPPKYANMSPEQFLDALEKGGPAAVTEAVKEGLLSGDFVQDLRSEIEQETANRIYGELGPVLEFVGKLKVGHDLDELAQDKNFGPMLDDTLKAEVRRRTLAPGNTLPAREIFLELAAAKAAELASKVQQLEGRASAGAQANAAASEATRAAGTHAPAAVTPPGGNQPSEEEQFFGRPNANEDIPGTGLQSI
jgi:hypothetical protein